MTAKNSPEQYGSVSKSLHWIMAVLVIGLLALGLAMHELPNGSTKMTAYGLHKSFGIVVLALVFCRLCWHAITPPPGAAATFKPWESVVRKIVHLLLYVLMIVLPLSGWLMSSAAGRPVQVFGFPPLPDLVPADQDMREVYGDIHEILGNALMAILFLHLAAVVKHVLINKDGVLRRMLPAVVLCLSLSLSSAPAEAATKWNILHHKSSLTFQAKQMGSPFEGRFTLYTAEIAFDPENLAAGKAVVEIDLASVSTGAGDRDENLKGKEWFDVLQFPRARFETKTFRKTGENAYETDAALTIRDKTVPVTLPFTLSIEGKGEGAVATVDGTVVLNRADFGIGTGEWADTSIIANEVSVHIHLVATASS